MVQSILKIGRGVPFKIFLDGILTQQDIFLKITFCMFLPEIGLAELAFYRKKLF